MLAILRSLDGFVFVCQSTAQQSNSALVMCDSLLQETGSTDERSGCSPPDYLRIARARHQRHTPDERSSSAGRAYLVRVHLHPCART
eukprot:3818551-Pleurochrysis_carterae.AAC.2